MWFSMPRAGGSGRAGAHGPSAHFGRSDPPAMGGDGDGNADEVQFGSDGEYEGGPGPHGMSDGEHSSSASSDEQNSSSESDDDDKQDETTQKATSGGGGGTPGEL